jgi:hypothetical protein
LITAFINTCCEELPAKNSLDSKGEGAKSVNVRKNRRNLHRFTITNGVFLETSHSNNPSWKLFNNIHPLFPPRTPPPQPLIFPMKAPPNTFFKKQIPSSYLQSYCRLASLVYALALFTTPSHGQLQSMRQQGETLGLFEAGDRFGASVASGDFNHDGFGDVAAGAPNEKVGNSSLTSGFVAVNYGTPYGIGWTSRQKLEPGIVADVDFGVSLASGDFNDDDYDDLAVGATGFHYDGRVYVYYGSPSGLDTENPDIFNVTDFGYSLNGFDKFGSTLAVGHLEGDNYADLAIGAHGFGTSGAVFVLQGSANGLTTTGGSSILGSTLPDPVPANGSFGRAIAFGDLAGLSYEDLIVGSPGANVNGSALNGMVHIIPGIVNSPHLSGGGAVAYDWSDFSGTNISDSNSFGSSIAVGKFADNDNASFDMVAIGVPGYESGSGRVAVAKGSFTGLQFVTQFSSAGLGTAAGNSEAGDFFGQTLVAVDNNGDGYDDLAIASPGEDAEPSEGVGASSVTVNTGVVYIVSGMAVGLDKNNNSIFWHKYIARNFDANTDMGFAMAKAHVTSGSFESLLIGAPGAYNDAGEVIDYAPWRQPAAPQCTSATVVGCENIMIYALRPFEQLQVASTTKIMTCLLAIEATQLQQGNPDFRSLNLEYPIEGWMQTAYPASTNCSAFVYPPNDSVSFTELIRTSIMVSGNDSVMAIADVMTNEINNWAGAAGSAPLFVQMMNDRAAELGMDDSLFTNPPGIDTGTPYSTAWDMQLLARTAMNNSQFRSFAGATLAQVSHLVPSGVPPGFQQGIQNVTYNWLTNLKNNVPSAIGIKPGGTPLAGTTGCMAAPDPSAPNDSNRIILANYFGITGNDILAGSRRARILQFGLDKCPNAPPAPLGPNQFLAPNTNGLVPTPTLPIGMASSIVFSDPIKTRDQSPTEFNFVIQGTGSRAAEGVAVKMHYRVLFQVEPDEVIQLVFHGVTGFDEIIIGNTENQPDAFLEFELDDGSGRTMSLGLLLPAIQQYTQSASPADGIIFNLANVGSESNMIALQFNGMLYAPNLGAEAPYRDTFLIEQNDVPIRANADVFLYRTTTPPTQQSLTLAFAEPGTDFISYPALENFTPAIGSDRSFVLNWETVTDYYDGFKILSTTDLTIPRENWTEVDDVEAAATELNIWTTSFPSDAKRFYSVHGYLAP